MRGTLTFFFFHATSFGSTAFDRHRLADPLHCQLCDARTLVHPQTQAEGILALISESRPGARFHLCCLRYGDAADRGAIVKCQRQELQGEEIGKHLESGKQVTRLGLNFDDHVSFVLGEDLVVRKLKFLDGAVDQLENTERESLHAELDARFALMSGELKRLFVMLEAAFKLSRAEA